MDVDRSSETLHWLLVGCGPEWAPFLASMPPARRVVSVDTWPDAVRHLVAFSTVRAVLLGAGCGTHVEQAITRVYAMKPGVTVYLASTVGAPDAPSVRRLSPTEVPPDVWP